MIIYFSSTGNSLALARDLALRLNDVAVHINAAAKQGVISDELIGFVVPVHNYDLPRLVVESIQSMTFSAMKYSFGIITHGGDRGNAIYSFQDLMKAKGQELNYYNDILMPVNSRIMYGRTTDKIEERTQLAKETVIKIAADISEHKQLSPPRKNRLMAVMHNMVESEWLRKRMTPVVNTELCTNCGICQRVCPVSNITVKADKAFVENHCEQCTTCLHWCPEVAIHYPKRKVSKEQQYHHPEVRVKDLSN